MGLVAGVDRGGMGYVVNEEGTAYVGLFFLGRGGSLGREGGIDFFGPPASSGDVSKTFWEGGPRTWTTARRDRRSDG